MELAYHVEGMLTRDQRTAKFCVRDTTSSSSRPCGDSYRSIDKSETRQLRNQDSGVSHTVPGRTSPSTFRIREKEHRHFWVTTLSRLHRTVLLCFYLSLFAFPKTSSAPIRMEKWMVPCGERAGRSSSNQIELLQTIIEQSKRSLVKVEAFKEKFAKEAFHLEWTDVQRLGSGFQSLEWLPKIEKELGKPLSPEELDKVELEALLKDTYQYLQIIAVAVDQMIIDEEQTALAKDYRNQIEVFVLSILCEIQTATNTLNVVRHKDVERTIVHETDKKGDSTSRYVRHYMIISHYLRVLEYIIESYEHVKSKL